MSETYRWRCVCGWSLTRAADASNLPAENNARIARSVAELHANRPRFGAAADETHVVSEVTGDAE